MTRERRTSRVTLATFILLVNAAARAATQAIEPAAGPGPGEGHPSVGDIRLHDADRSRRVFGLARVHWNYPLQISGASGVIVTTLPRDFDCTTTCAIRGLTAQGAVGVGGIEASIGYGSLVGETGKSRAFLRHVYVGYGIRAAYVRTSSASHTSPGDDFVGIETGWTVTQFSFTVGVFRRVPADDPGQRTKVFGGIGWGF